VRLILVCDVCRSIDDCEGCLRLGDAADLRPIYEKADVLTNPRHFGTGLSIETIEPMGYSKPVRTTSVESMGLEDGANKAFLVSDNPPEFARSAVKVLTDDQLANRLSTRAFEYVNGWNEASMKELANVLE
jgi:hypothetical protein